MKTTRSNVEKNRASLRTRALLAALGLTAAAACRGESPAEDFPSRGSTEITGLARAFERMRTSLEKALKLLEP